MLKRFIRLMAAMVAVDVALFAQEGKTKTAEETMTNLHQRACSVAHSLQSVRRAN